MVGQYALTQWLILPLQALSTLPHFCFMSSLLCSKCAIKFYNNSSASVLCMHSITIGKYKITHFSWHANGLRTYQLAVKESLVCGPPTKKHVTDMTLGPPRRKTTCVPPVQPQTQQCQAAQSVSPAQTQIRKLIQSMSPAQLVKSKLTVS